MTESAPSQRIRVGIVGPCVSGKSTLAQALNAAGYDAHAISQEHSYVPYMWQRITGPDVLVYLDVDYAAAKARRPRIDWGPERLVEQANRLAHARAHCDLYLDTSDQNEDRVAAQVISFLSTYS